MADDLMPTSGLPPASATGLALPGQLHVAADTDLLYDDLAYALLRAAFDAIKERGVFHLALSGGSTPEPFYMRLVIDPRFRSIPWESIHVWLVDERAVPHDDPKSNYGMIRQTLLDHVPMKRRHHHPPYSPPYSPPPPNQAPRSTHSPTSPSLSPGSPPLFLPNLSVPPSLSGEKSGDLRCELEQAAANHVQEMSQIIGHAPGQPPRFDFALLGMGTDGHIASLFPNSPALAEQEKWYTVNDGPNVVPPARLTMTYPMLNTVRRLAILVTSDDKAEMIKKVAASPLDYPVGRLKPIDGRVTWYLPQTLAQISGLMDS